MNNLEKLIQELCPQGVERKRLGDIGVVVRGNGLQKKDFTESGVGCIHYGQIYTYYGTCAYKTKSFVSHELAEKLQKVNKGDLVIAVTSENVEDVGKCVVWLGDEQIVTGAHAAIFRHNQDPKYVAYWFQTNDFFTQKKRIAKGTKVIDLTPQKLEEVTMPVPPLPVQREIVQILDNFTELTEEITEKLTAELTARKKQYEYYRDTLLTFGVHRGGTFEAKWRALGEVCGLQAGKAIPAIEISPVQTKEYSVPCYGGNGLRGYVRTANQRGDKPLVGRQGALCGNVCYATGSYYTTEHAVVVSDKGFFNSRFLYHALVHANLNQYKTAGAQPGLSVAKLEKVKIPVPEKEIQDRIAKVLDNFDAICSDLNIGLPAEIEARQKQYEYYRDKLLAFKELDNCE